MAAFQREGHTGVLIVGDYTTRIGDPSGRSATRPVLSDEQIDAHAQRFLEQASTIIDPDRTEVRFNGEWLAQLDFAEILRLTRIATVARLLERDDFSKRFATGSPISISELLYPLMQAYDSVAVEADVELGGTDQLYNLLMGREVMQAYGLEPQLALTVEYLVSWDELGDERLARQLHRPQGGAGGAVRKGDADPGLAARAVVQARHGAATAGRRSARGEAGARTVHRRAVARCRRRAGGRGALHARRPRRSGAG